MEVEAVGAGPSRPVPSRAVQLVGVTAELAEARTQLRRTAPADRWESVQAEVHRLQHDQGMSPLAALQAVYAKLASGWVPPLPR